MQRNLTSTIAGAPKQGRKLSPVVIGGAALVLAAVAGVATWQGIAQRDGAQTTATDPVVAQVTTSATQPVSAALLRSDQLTVYMVGSQAEATRVMDTIAEGNRLLDQFGKPAFNADVIVITSAAEEEWVLRANAESDSIRASMGLPPMKVIDLRGR
jgi:hypothetical protein